LVGISSAAALVGTLQVATTAARGSVVVSVFPDFGDKYLCEYFWEEKPAGGGK
jgi:cysteine synthase